MPSQQEIAAAIARNVKTMRTRMGWSLDELASRSGVSKGMLVQIEQARTNPSVVTLNRIAEALGIAIARLVDLAETPVVRVIRASEVVTLWQTGRGSVANLLVGYDGSDHIEFWDWRLAAGDRYQGDPHLPGTREMIHVLSGRLRLDVDGREHMLEPGDIALFAADRPHEYGNAGDTPVRMALVVVQPTPPPEGV